jgi:P27 family predicted phage terminase small subunit
LEGNPGKRPLPQDEPKPAPIAPECPKHLAKAAKDEWNRITPELEKLGLLTRIDMAALAAYCQAYARWIEAEKMIKKHGVLVQTPNGYPVVSPYMTIINKALDHMKGFLVEFGLTPASRTRIGTAATGDNKKSKIKNLLSG